MMFEFKFLLLILIYQIQIVKVHSFTVHVAPMNDNPIMKFKSNSNSPMIYHKESLRLFAIDSSILRNRFYEFSNHHGQIPITKITSSDTVNSSKSQLYLYQSKASFDTSTVFRRKRRVQMQLVKPLKWYSTSFYYSTTSTASSSTTPGRNIRTELNIFNSSGFTYDDGEQILISAQKPLGLVLEERNAPQSGCIVIQVEPGSVADKSGVQFGDVLLAVQNVNVEEMNFDEVMDRIVQAPKVVNLRFWRCKANSNTV